MSKIFSSNNSLGSLLEQVNALLHKEKSCVLKYFQEYFLTTCDFFFCLNWTAYVLHATIVRFLSVKYSPKPTACYAGGSGSPDVIPLIVSELILGVEGYSFGRE